ncbi:MAG: hypothetical protein LC106_10225, partial [Burkholderiales bacterium]|nr:hypothetical protein [Burkholderiales bacterium]
KNTRRKPGPTCNLPRNCQPKLNKKRAACAGIHCVSRHLSLEMQNIQAQAALFKAWLRGP